MADFLRSTPAQIVIWVSVLTVLSVLGVYIALWFRNRQDGEPNSANELLTEFRDLREEGRLSPAEFGKIRSVLGEKLQDEVGSKDAESMG